MKTKRRHSYRTRNLAIALVLLAAANLLIGSVLVAESKASLKAQIDQRMLDIANTAAYNLNGRAQRSASGSALVRSKENDASIMLKALETCATLEDFEHLLDSLKTEEELAALAQKLKAKYPETKFYPSHCTGDKVFAILKAVMGDQLHAFSCGIQKSLTCYQNAGDFS